MKKTIEQIVDENPDLSPEEHTAIWQQENVASNESGRLGLSEKPEAYQDFGLGILKQRTANNVDNITDMKTEKLPPVQVPPMLEASAKYPEELKTQPDMPVESDLPSDVPPAKDKVSQLFEDRAKREASLEGEIEGEEDAIRRTRQSSGTEKGLYAAGEIASGMLGNILKYDASPQVKGFQKAGKFVDERTDENRQRREFLKERLYRADNPGKQYGEELKMRGEVRSDDLENATKELKKDAVIEDLGADTIKSRLAARAGRDNLNMYNPNSPTAKKSAEIDKAQLERVAKGGGQNAEAAKIALENYDTVEGLGSETMPMRNKLMGDLLKAEKDGKSWSLENYRKGNIEGSMLVEKTTGEYKDLGSGVKTPGVGSGNANREDDMAMKLSDRLAKANMPALKAGLDRVNETIRKNGGKVKNVDGTDRVSRMTPSFLQTYLGTPEGLKFKQELSNVSNQVLKAASGASVTVGESERLIIDELQQGKLTSPEQIETGIRMVNELYDQINSNIQGAFTPSVKQKYVDQGGMDINAKASEANGPKKSWRDYVGGK